MPPGQQVNKSTGQRSRRSLGILSLAAVIFLTVSGGPYGLEPLLGYAGREGALLLLILTPLIWDIPAILTVLELNSMMPVEGGYYAWVKSALGLRFAFYEGWWTWLYTFVDLAIYPVLFVTYAAYFWPGVETYRIPVCLVIVWGGALLNILGIAPVGKLSLALGAAVLIPFLWLACSAIGNPAAATPIPAPALGKLPLPALGMGLYTVMWNFFGWDNATTYAGEVRNAAATYIRAIVLAFCAVVVLYLITMIVVELSGIDAQRLADGGFPALGRRIGGPALGAAIAIGGLAAQLGLYNAVLLSVSRVPEVMARDRLLPQVLTRLHPRFGTPWVSILVCALVVSVFVFKSFGDLLVIDVTLYGAELFVEFVALIALRLRKPAAERPFRIPLPVWGLALLYLLPVGIYALALSGAFLDGGGGFGPALIAAVVLLSAEPAWQIARYFRRGNEPDLPPTR